MPAALLSMLNLTQLSHFQLETRYGATLKLGLIFWSHLRQINVLKSLVGHFNPIRVVLVVAVRRCQPVEILEDCLAYLVLAQATSLTHRLTRRVQSSIAKKLLTFSHFLIDQHGCR